jgi:hypothetical protein
MHIFMRERIGGAAGPELTSRVRKTNWRARFAACVAAAFFVPGAAIALDLVGPTSGVRLVNGTVGAAGGPLTNPGSGATASAETTSGEASVGVSTGPSSGVKLESGFLATVKAVPEPSAPAAQAVAALTLALLSLLRRRRNF